MRFRIVVFTLLLCACTTPIPLIGKFENNNDTLTGQASSDLFQNGTSITIRTKDAKLSCSGSSRMLQTTVGNVVVRRYGVRTCTGDTGTAELTCNDGRHVTAEWQARDCNSGYGVGSDEKGATFFYAFGVTDFAARQYFASAARRVAPQPRLPFPPPKDAAPGAAIGMGTGFLISTDGLVVTNSHVVDGGKAIEVHSGGTGHPAKVVIQDRANDLAILQTDLTGHPLPLGSSRLSSRGEDVLTLGFPLPNTEGQSQKATFGRINALTGIGDDGRYLQIDVPIQPGNSGGPLLNRRGEVIGVVSQSLNDLLILRATGAVPQNVNYAVKADYIGPLLPANAKVVSSSSMSAKDFADVVRETADSVFLIVVAH